MIHLKRIYEDYEESDGYRILVDRIWPRGISKEHAHLDLWLKAIAPSTEVRKTFGHQSENFPSFVKAYRQELQTDTEKQQAVKQLIALVKQEPVVTLVYAAKNEKENQAVVLKEYIEKQVDG
ncbi:hypothetical protein A5844_000564 [Enterococcus sp. 10A9_DIV0425]|uniref:MarR family transcriptional regulator n=1 Tax=Candidatus Enterococcus wittei TaxID=1987383 RepID=A0A2C9XQ50_9ENTE|nr:DUF488 domain-containing protein [Enterococcus sp. 10A9_DIV0425]OTP12332.1 hypothetical protein A5844_000564 [Enterococcus sp. 10A9_DIV0425]THE11129.1 DUF488 domain-containing protein [Enterococcus hirae]